LSFEYIADEAPGCFEWFLDWTSQLSTRCMLVCSSAAVVPATSRSGCLQGLETYTTS
jgi:hypothetical protein